MPTYTTPDAIISPILSDKLGPIQSWFQQQAASVQAALTALRSEVAQEPLADPLSVKGADVQSITSTAWANVPNISAITLTLPQACWVTIVAGAWLVTTAGDVRCSANVTGATSLSETQLEVGGSNSAWGQVMYSNPTGGTRQMNSHRMVRLNAGVNTINLRGLQGGGGTSQINYSTLQVSPVRWA